MWEERPCFDLEAMAMTSKVSSPGVNSPAKGSDANCAGIRARVLLDLVDRLVAWDDGVQDAKDWRELMSDARDTLAIYGRSKAVNWRDGSAAYDVGVAEALEGAAMTVERMVVVGRAWTDEQAASAEVLFAAAEAIRGTRTAAVQSAANPPGATNPHADETSEDKVTP